MSIAIDNTSVNAVMTTVSDNISSNGQHFDDVYDSDDEVEIYGDSDSHVTGAGKRGKFVPMDELHFQVKNRTKLYDDSGRPRMFTTQFYATRYMPGARIRNAATSLYEKHRCGSIYENLYFKVSHATGEFGNKDPLVLFYDSPEQYERHWNVRIPQDSKDTWQSKYVEAQRRLLRDE
jgi:hypothetical protein